MKPKPSTNAALLTRRIRQFYALLNDRDFRRCHEMIDPRLLEKPSTVTLLQYETALAGFLRSVGEVRVLEVGITALHLDEPNKLYEGRDFAIAKTIWTDKAGGRHEFVERWVRDGKSWYTRSTGLLAPTPTPAAPEPSVPNELIRAGDDVATLTAKPGKATKSLGRRNPRSGVWATGVNPPIAHTPGSPGHVTSSLRPST